MNNLKLKISIELYENVPCTRLSCDDIAVSHHALVINSEIRSKYTHEELKNIIKKEIPRVTEFATKDLIDKIKLPLNTSIGDQEKIHKETLENLFPGIGVTVYHSEGIFVLLNFFKKGGPYNIDDILHPLDPCGGWLTSRHLNMYSKLNDGTWSYAYNSHHYYEGIVERVPAPIDEKVVDQYFKTSGINYKIDINTILPLPEAEARKPRESDDGDFVIE